MSTAEDVTLVKNAIHNPNEPRHFMRITPAAGRQVATLDGTVLADSDRAVVVKEVGRDIYDHVVYFPREDVNMAALDQVDRSTHCPLKGDTAYFDGLVDDRRHGAVAWSYVETIDVAAELQDLVAFDAAQVTVGDAPGS